MSRKLEITATFERLKNALSDRYALEQEIGSGGMATVYLARDLRHNRRVAVKVLRPELSASLGANRFLREIEIAARLQHPHILMLIDSGERDGFLFYVMPYFEGESLRERLDREHQLPIEEALQIARQVASALAHAHKLGVVHRDVKPGNILLAGNDAMVADFGIARAVSVAESRNLTDTGIILGTPAYMSPEQIATQDVDGRSDIYSLACVLYEMLAGEPPFSGSTSQAILARHAIDPVPPLRTLRRSVPITLENTITTALAKSPADRYSNALHFSQVLMECGREISGAYRPPPPPPPPATEPVTPIPVTAEHGQGNGRRIRDVGLAAAFVAVILLLIGQPWSGRPQIGAVEGSPFVTSVAVMPLHNLTGRPEIEHLGILLADEIIAHLSDIDTLKVIPLTSVLAIRDRGLTATQISDTLKVEYVLEGSTRDGANGSEITARLIDGRSGRTLWSRPYAADLSDPASLESISRQVTELFVSSVGGLTIGSSPSHVVQSAGGQAYEQGVLGLQRRTPDGIAVAITSFDEAVRLDSANVPAIARLSTAYGLAITYRYEIGVGGYEAAGRALNLANRAILLAPQDADAYAARAYIGSRAHGPEQQVIDDFSRAQELAPNAPSAPSWFALLLAQQGRPELALTALERSITLDPLSPSRRIALALEALRLGQAAMALEAARTAQALQGGIGMTQSIAARSLLLLGRAADCAALPLGPHAAIRAACLHDLGRVREATAIIDSVQSAVTAGQWDPAYTEVLFAEDLSAYYAWIGDVAGTVRWLRRSFELSPRGIETRLIESPLFDRVRADQRFVSAWREVRAAAWPTVMAAAAEDRAQTPGGP